MHVLGHVRCPRESMESSEPSSFGAIERGSLSSKDNLFPCDPSRPFPPSSHPSTSLVPSVVAPIVLGGAFPVNHFPSRVRLIPHVSWRVSHLVVLGGFRRYWLSGCRLARNLYLLCLCFGAVFCVRRGSAIVIRIQWALQITRKRTPGLTKPVVLLLSCALFLPFVWNPVGANSGSESIDSPAVTTAAKSSTAARPSSSSKAARASSSSTEARASWSSTAARASSSSTAALKSSSSTAARASAAAANSPKAGPGRKGVLLPPKSPELRYV